MTVELPVFNRTPKPMLATEPLEPYAEEFHPRRRARNVRRKAPSAWNYVLAFIGFAFLLTAVYSPLLLYQFGFNDDYFALFERLRNSDWMQAMHMQFCLQARPLEGLVYIPQVAFINSIKDLVYVRLAGIVYLTILATCFYCAFQSIRWSRWQSFAASLCLCALPSFQVLLSWGTALQFVVPGILAFASWRILRISDTESIVWKILKYAGAFALLSAAVTIYQPTAMLFWVFVAISLADLEAPLAERGQFLLTAACVAFSAYLVDFAAFQWAKHTFGTAGLLPGRTNLNVDMIGKIKWFIRNPMVDSLNFFRLQNSITFAGRAAIFLLCGFILYIRGNMRTLGISLGVACGLIVLAYLPNLLIAESLSFYRTQTALACLLTFYAMIAIRGILKLFFCRERSFTAIMLPAALCFGLIAYSNVLDFFAVPQSLELTLLREQIQGKFGEAMVQKPILLRREEPLAPFVCYDEFGMPSSAQAFDRIPLQVLLKMEKLDKKMR
jgi:hypothetical protein